MTMQCQRITDAMPTQCWRCRYAPSVLAAQFVSLTLLDDLGERPSLLKLAKLSLAERRRLCVQMNEECDLLWKIFQQKNWKKMSNLSGTNSSRVYFPCLILWVILWLTCESTYVWVAKLERKLNRTAATVSTGNCKLGPRRNRVLVIPEHSLRY